MTRELGAVMPWRELRIELDGQNAVLGEIPARDVARLLLGVESAVMRAASVVLGRPKTTVGRADRAIERAARFRLRAIEAGSVVPVLELPEPEIAGPETLDLDATSLAEMAVVQVLDTIDAGDGHPVVATALLELADDRYDVTFDLRGRGKSMRKARLDRAVRSQLRHAIEREEVRVRDDALVGTLVEADFEKNTARLRGPFNELVTVSFEDHLADDIQDALRQQSTFRGEIAYDRETLAARSVRLRAVTRGRQLVLGIDPGAFWNERTLDMLTIDQGGIVATEPDEIYDADATEEERDAFMAALAELGL